MWPIKSYRPEFEIRVKILFTIFSTTNKFFCGVLAVDALAAAEDQV
jgi:hypothetical protein